MNGPGWRLGFSPRGVHIVQPVTTRHYPLGIDAPAGVDLRNLPSGYRDYIRPVETATPTTAAPQGSGIDLPSGAVLAQLPPGVTDYIRRTWPGLLSLAPATSPEPGVDAPYGVDIRDLPPGYRDYVRMER
ncbi:MAG: hypothetical protein HXY39_15135 [Chloroflexi bacterium]|nr:hypothetical protein [Chloroflexota bacterium]